MVEVLWTSRIWTNGIMFNWEEVKLRSDGMAELYLSELASAAVTEIVSHKST